ncbi:MAG: hypothetical protein AAFU85_18750 [Planctomycetota bacterium]
MAELLSTLDEIDWNALHHAYGNASNLPEVLRAFAFGSLAERQQKLEEEWWGSIIHQGTYFSATEAVVPFLIEIALAEKTVKRYELVSELHQLTIGFVERFCQGRPKVLFASLAPPKQSVIHDEGYVRASYDRAVAAAEELSCLMQDPDEETRIATTFLLSSFVTQWQGVATALLDALDQESNSRVRSAIILSLTELRAALVEYCPADRKRLSEVLTRRWRGFLLHHSNTRDAEYAAVVLMMLGCDDGVEQVTAVAASRMLVESDFELPSFDSRRSGGPFFLWDVYDALSGHWLDRRSMIVWALEHDDIRVRSKGIQLLAPFCRRYRDMGRVSLVETLGRMLQDDRWAGQHADIAEELVSLGARGLAISRSVADRFPRIRKRLDSFDQGFAFWDCEASTVEPTSFDRENESVVTKSLHQLEAIEVPSDENLRAIADATRSGSPKVRAAAVATFHRVTGDNPQTVELILAAWELDFIAVPLLRLLGRCGVAATHLKGELDSFIASNERYVSAGWLSGICLLDDKMLDAAREARSKIP